MKKRKIVVTLSPRLEKNLDFISEHLHVSKESWLKLRIANEIERAIHDLMSSADRRYIAALISKEEYKKIIGRNPLSDVENERKEARILGKKTVRLIQGMR